MYRYTKISITAKTFIFADQKKRKKNRNTFLYKELIYFTFNKVFY